jgi:hypothetical protein
LHHQDQLIVQIECWDATSFGLIGFMFFEHSTVRTSKYVWFDTKGSSEDWTGETENSSGERLYVFSFAGQVTFAEGLLTFSIFLPFDRRTVELTQ